jgi:hypothetical protein
VASCHPRRLSESSILADSFGEDQSNAATGGRL